MDRPSGTAAGTLLVRVALTFALAALGPGCILDFEGLTGSGTGGAAGSGGTPGGSGSGGTTTGGTGGTGGGGGGTGGAGGGCSALDCCPAGDVIELAMGAAIADLPRGIVAADDAIYWVNFDGGNVVRLPAAGGAATPIATADSPRTLALSGDRLVWTAKDGVHTCTVPACADEHLVTPSIATDSLRAIAFDGATIAFTDRGSGANDGRARSCAIDACAPVDLVDGLLAPEGIVLEGPLAVWTDQGNGNMNGVVARSPKDLADVKQLAAALQLPTGVATDETYVYWTEQLPAGHVYRCPINGPYCDTNQLEDVAPAADPLGRPADIAIAGGRIYWMNADDGSILSCPQPGCGPAEKPKVHVTGRTGLARLAIGSTCLFWTENGGGGGVFKTAR